MIEVFDLQVDYEGTLKAVDNITFTVPPGEICGLIGNNGAGKTSTMNAIMGLTEITHGQIFLNGIDAVKNREAALAKTGFMPDFGITCFDLKLWEFLDLFAACYDIPEDERPALIDYYLELLNLADKKHEYTKGISRGMTQRLMLAKTLIADPVTIILDEPASGLDPASRQLMKNILVQKKEEGKAILISSHVLPDLEDICTQVAIMDNGKLTAFGNIAEIARNAAEHDVKYRIEVTKNAKQAAEIIESSGMVKDIDVNVNHIIFSFNESGSADDLITELIKKIISEDIKLLSFGKAEMNIEMLMNITNKQQGEKNND